MDTSKSKEAFERARQCIPGGVNSPVRAFANVGRHPLFIEKAKGAYIWDIDQNQYIDYVGSWGPMVLGHCFADVVEAVREAACQGTSFGAPCVYETMLAELICQMTEGVDLVRMVNSGTEATMSALRLARGFTGRDLIIKFEGCYHGHSDSLLIQAGSGALTFGSTSSAGVPADTARHTLVLPYNDFEALEAAFSKMGEQIAAVIFEPVCGNMGVVPPKEGYLAHIRDLTQRWGAVMIMDEVMTGFRLSLGGAQQYYGVTPDLITFGKIIGGGLPVGAYGGRRDIMDYVSPSGPVYQAGTLSGNPLAMRAGIAQLSYLRRHPKIYTELEQKSARLEKGLLEAASAAGIRVCINRVGSMMSVFFTGESVIDFKSANTSDTGLFGRYFNGMLNQGIYLAPSQFEAVFVSAAHTEADIDTTLQAARKVFSDLAG